MLGRAARRASTRQWRGLSAALMMRLCSASSKRAKARGLKCGGHIGLWSYGGEVYPEFALRDLEGRPLDRRYQEWGIGLCPEPQGGQ